MCGEMIPPKKKLKYKQELHRQLRNYGIDFLQNMAILGMQRTLINCFISDNNFFLMRLLYLAAHVGLQSRKGKSHDLETFPFHVASAFSHGKRIQLNTDNLEKITQWLKYGIENKIFRRPSSHALVKHKSGEFKENIGLRCTATLDFGLNLAIFGKGKVSPYTHGIINDDGHFGHFCIVKNTYSGTTGGSLLFGLENSAPLKKDQQGSNHGINCSSNEWSALFLPKWGSEFFTEYADSHLPLPNESTNTLLMECRDNIDKNLGKFLVNDTEVMRFVKMELLSDDQLLPLSRSAPGSPILAWS